MAGVEKPLCETCRFRVLHFYKRGKMGVFGEWAFECSQVGRGWLKTCQQYEREPGSDDE